MAVNLINNYVRAVTQHPHIVPTPYLLGDGACSNRLAPHPHNWWQWSSAVTGIRPLELDSCPSTIKFATKLWNNFVWCSIFLSVGAVCFFFPFCFVCAVAGGQSFSQKETTCRMSIADKHPRTCKFVDSCCEKKSRGPSKRVEVSLVSV